MRDQWKHAPPTEINIESDVGLAPLTTMRVGGKAEYFAKVATIESLVQVVQWAQQEKLPYLVLGGGSNILVSDAGVRGLVIQNRCRRVELPDSPLTQARIATEVQNATGVQLVAESGAAMAGAARTSIRGGLTGLEWAVSVPGTVGGAIVNNAGAHGGEIKDNLLVASIIDERGNLMQESTAGLHYSYRHSALKSQASPSRASFQPVVLSGTFALSVAVEAEVKERANEYLNHRRRTQPNEPSLGSMFMNPRGDFAGRLIEVAGLKGAQIGGIRVSDQHANFIINEAGVGGGTAADVVALIKLIQERVEAQFGVTLKPEVQLVGEWDREDIES